MAELRWDCPKCDIFYESDDSLMSAELMRRTVERHPEICEGAKA